MSGRLLGFAGQWPRLLVLGLGVMALASVAKTAPAFIGLGIALLAVLIGLGFGYRPRWDGVEIIVAIIALWLTTRLLLQQVGVGDPDLLRPWHDFTDWAWLLTFVALGAGDTDPVQRVRLLWLLAMGGFALGVAGYFVAVGFEPLLAGERLGFHLRRPLGVGLYAGAFLLMVLFTAAQWWTVRGRLRFPARVLGTAMILQCFVVLVGAQNRSTWLGLAIVGAGAVIGIVARAVKTHADPRRRLAAVLFGLLLVIGIGLLVKVPLETRTSGESQALTTLLTEGLGDAPATPITIRLRLWSFVLTQFPQAPLLGQGFGKLEEVLERELRHGAPLQQDERQDHVHSTYLQVLYGQGLIGCALWASLLLLLLRDLTRAARRAPEIRRLLPATWAVLAFTGVWALTDYRLSHPDMLFFSILLLLSLRLLGRSSDSSRPPPPQGSRTGTQSSPEAQGHVDSQPA
ncbi:MAG: O-antigen ligase family protein [Chromatiaceae bacterium]|jgi:O-antigen ligase|nr:O-antigen ligase family protein [Chromatiaceae bacterium]